MEEKNQSYRQREDEIANYLAADRATKSAEQRRMLSEDEEGDPFEEPEDDYYDTADDSSAPYTSEQNQGRYAPGSIAENQNGGSTERYAPGSIAERNEQQRLASIRQAQQEQEIQLAMASSKQRKLHQVQQELNATQKKLSELGEDLSNFKNSSLGGFLSIFYPRINLLIDILIEQLKKQTRGLSDEAKVGFYTSLITTVTGLIGILSALKILAAFLDAGFIVSYSCLRLVVSTLYTCIIPIILIIISPIYVPFLALLFLIGKIPALKGLLTKNIIGLIEKLKKQRAAWEKARDKASKRVALRKRIKSLKNAQRQIAQQR